MRTTLRRTLFAGFCAAGVLLQAGGFFRGIFRGRARALPSAVAVRASDLARPDLTAAAVLAAKVGAGGLVVRLGAPATPQRPAVAFGPDMPVAAAGRLRAALARSGVRILACEVPEPAGPAALKRAVAAAKLFAIPYVIAELPPRLPAGIAGLCRDSGVRLALRIPHLDGKASVPAKTRSALVESVRPRGWVGWCLDVGRLARAGLDPAVWAEKSLGAAPVFVVFAVDLDLASPEGRPVAPGAGVCHLPRLLASLKRRGFSGPLVLLGPGAGASRAEQYFRGGTAYLAQCAALRPLDLLRGKALPPGMSWNVFDAEKPRHPENNARWPRPKPVDLSAYRITNRMRGARITAGSHGVVAREDYPNVFDGKPSKWCTACRTPWIVYQYPGNRRVRVIAYTVTSANDVPDRDPEAWRLLGSNDGTHWTELDRRDKQIFLLRHETKLYKVQRPGAYNRYRFEVLRNHGNPKLCQFQELQLLARKK